MGRVTALWMPVYTPNLNPMERVWRFLKQKLACHRFWADGDALAHAAATFLDQLEAHYHAENAPGIRLVQHFCEAA